jgi:hypothetical protein
LRDVVSANEFDAMAEDFGAKKRKRFGEDGFTNMVDRVRRFERAMGIDEPARVTAQ